MNVVIDIEAVKERIDCRDIVRRDLGEPDRRHGDYLMYKCPFHQDGTPSMSVHQGYWHCFGCGKGGDGIKWLQERFRMTFMEAINALGGDAPLPANPYPVVRARYTAKAKTIPDGEWQEITMRVMAEAEAILWSPAGVPAMNYLKHKRGFNEETIKAARLGYLPGHWSQWVTREGINFPCGVTIPWVVDGIACGMKVRRSGGEHKYMQPAGGQISRLLYMADEINPEFPILVVEGEFNALAVRQACGDKLSAVSIGSASGTIAPRWYATLANACQLLCCFDQDEAGNKGATRLRYVFERVRALSLPLPHKDMNDFLVADTNGLRRWLIDNTKE